MTLPPENSVHPLTRSEWRAWLSANHTRTEGVWLVTYKTATGQPRVEYEDAVEEAIAFGWIDSKVNKLDDQCSLLWFSPRKPGTGWSRPNKQRVARLVEAGLMQLAGQAKIDAAVADGSWTKLDGVELLEIPADLEAALTTYESAADNFAAFPRSAKRGILEWILNAKRPETRAKRVAETALLADSNQRANQWRGGASQNE